MADATMTQTSSLNLDQATWDLALYYALRPQLYFDMFADVKSTNAAPARGVSVTFELMNDLAAATTTLGETDDVATVLMSDSQVTVTLLEKGNAINTSYKARATAYLPLEPAVTNVLGYNAGISIDTIARDVLVAGTNVRYGGAATSRVTVAAGHTLTAANVRRAYTDLVNASVVPFGSFYAAAIHPDQAYDLRTETGAAAWRDPHVYSQPNEIWNGEVGEFEGFRFFTSPRVTNFADAGVGGTVDVYAALFFGRQAIAKAYSTYEGRGPLPTVIESPVTDKLRRFKPWGWHWFGNYGVFRQASLRRVETSSSIGTNV
ncbi:MAG TPA: N4-gp56 family major capsid protein [Acidimicrobiales bacterium]|nr:N4-gp56 family major capsid protein [Acidimicrobiales bacterium]